jgi:hypothetical protein
MCPQDHRVGRPVRGQAGGHWDVNSLPEVLVVASVGVLLAFLARHLCNTMAWLLG